MRAASRPAVQSGAAPSSCKPVTVEIVPDRTILPVIQQTFGCVRPDPAGPENAMKRKSPAARIAPTTPAAALALVLLAAALAMGCQEIAVNTETVDEPGFDMAAGPYALEFDVALTHADPLAVIRYTTDGTTPTASSPPYTAPIHIAFGETTIKAIATKPGLAPSAVVSRRYAVPWKTLADMPGPPRPGSISAAVLGDSIHVTGFLDTDGHPIGSRLVYSISGDTPYTWSVVDSGVPTPSRNSAGSVVFGGQFFLIGGAKYESGWTTLSNVDSFSGAEWAAKGSLAAPRELCGSAATAAGIFAVGGYGGGYLSSVEYFDGSAWSASTMLPVALQAPACSVVGETLYAFGGYNASGASKEIFALATDPLGTEWIDAGDLPSPLTDIASVTKGDTVFLFGGKDGDGESVSAVHAFSGGTLEARTSMPRKLKGSVALTAGDFIYVVGGADGITPYPGLMVYDPSVDHP